MKALYERWTAISLPKRILGGMILGAVLGMMIPQAVGLSILGNLFVNALKGIAPLLVFFLVISSLCQAKQSHGGIIRTVVCLYLFNTLLGAVIAVVASKLFPITLTLAQAAEETSAPQGIAEVMQTLLLNVVRNPITSIAEATTSVYWRGRFSSAWRCAAPANARKKLWTILRWHCPRLLPGSSTLPRSVFSDLCLTLYPPTVYRYLPNMDGFSPCWLARCCLSTS